MKKTIRNYFDKYLDLSKFTWLVQSFLSLHLYFCNQLPPLLFFHIFRIPFQLSSSTFLHTKSFSLTARLPFTSSMLFPSTHIIIRLHGLYRFFVRLLTFIVMLMMMFFSLSSILLTPNPLVAPHAGEDFLRLGMPTSVPKEKFIKMTQKLLPNKCNNNSGTQPG